MEIEFKFEFIPEPKPEIYERQIMSPYYYGIVSLIDLVVVENPWESDMDWQTLRAGLEDEENQ